MAKILFKPVHAFFNPLYTMTNQPPFFYESVVWDQNEDGMLTYHVPTVFVAASGTVLAAADARYEEYGDFGPHHLAVKRSADGGRTWGENKFVGLSDRQQIFLFPNFVQPVGSPRIFLFYGEKDREDIHRRSHVWVRHSDDDGHSWSEPVDMAETLIHRDAELGEQVRSGDAGPQFSRDNHVLYGRKVFFPGPGVAIRLSGDHPLAPNRLLVPFLGMNDRFSHDQQRAQFNTVLFSDDHGGTWQAGGTVPIGAFPNSEPSIVEMSNGDLLLNIRVEHKYFRVVSRSTDAGMTWSEALRLESLPTFDQVHAGLLRLTFARNDPTGTNRLLFSFPNGMPDNAIVRPGVDEPYRPRRENMSVWMSYDEHLSWPVRKVIHSGPSYYSNLAANREGDIFLIYGRDGEHPWMPARTSVARFNLSWLTDGCDSLETGPRFF